MKLSQFFQGKFLLRLFVAMAVLALALRLAAPLLISSERLEREIKSKLSNWTDSEVNFAGTPRFSFWPQPQISLNDFKVRRVSSAGDGDATLTADRVSFDFSLIGSIIGFPDLGDIELVRPVLDLRRNDEGALNRGSTEVVSALAENDDDVASSLGVVTIQDGTVAVDDLRRGEHYQITDINGQIAWPELSSSLDISLEGVINGGMASWEFSTDEPSALLNGENVAVHTSFSSDPLTVEFDGSANLSANAYANGKIKLETPSVAHLLSWRGADYDPAEELGNVLMEASVTATGHSARFDNVNLSVQEAQARGSLELSLPPKGTPKIDGTLAFDRIDLASMIDAYTPLPGGDDDTLTSAAAIDQLDLDLRLSSAEAALEPLLVTDFAASIRANDGVVTLDIVDGGLLGGHMGGRLSVSESGRDGGGSLDLSLRDMELGALLEVFGQTAPLHFGRGSAEIGLSTDKPLRRLSWADLAGSFSFHLEQGTIESFDLPAFEELVRGKTKFSTKQVENGSFEFSSADIQGRLYHGLTHLTRATFEGADRTLSLWGTIPYRSSIALAGTLAAHGEPDAADVKQTLNFIAGGSWPSPVISPTTSPIQQSD